MGKKKSKKAKKEKKAEGPDLREILKRRRNEAKETTRKSRSRSRHRSPKPSSAFAKENRKRRKEEKGERSRKRRRSTSRGRNKEKKKRKESPNKSLNLSDMTVLDETGNQQEEEKEEENQSRDSSVSLSLSPSPERRPSPEAPSRDRDLRQMTKASPTRRRSPPRRRPSPERRRESPPRRRIQERSPPRRPSHRSPPRRRPSEKSPPRRRQQSPPRRQPSASPIRHRPRSRLEPSVSPPGESKVSSRESSRSLSLSSLEDVDEAPVVVPTRISPVQNGSRRSSYRSMTPSDRPRSRHSSHKSPSMSPRSRDSRRSIERRENGRRLSRDLEKSSWESKVDAFVNALGPSSSSVSKTPSKDSKPSTPLPVTEPVSPGEMNDEESVEAKKPTKEDPPPPGLEAAEDEAQFEDLKATPLVRYIGKKLTTNKKGQVRSTKLKLEGVFQYNLLSLLSRAEWVAAKSLKLLEEAGYKEDNLYFMATARGGLALENELKSAVFTGKVQLGSKPELVAQVLRVVECIVKYFTAQDGDESSSEEEEEKEDEGKKAPTKAVRGGVGALLMQLVVDKHDEEERKRKEEEELPKQPPHNPWTYMSDAINAESLKSFANMKVFIAKDMLRLGDETLCKKGNAFEVAQEMVATLVLAGHNHASLQHLVMQAAVEDILPPKDVVIVDKAGLERPTKRYLFDNIMDRINNMKGELPDLTKEQMEYCVRKSLLFIMRGCDKMPAPVKNMAGSNIVFNYLPPGLREMENKPKASTSRTKEDEPMLIDEGETPKGNRVVQPEDKESTDPLNSILNPSGNSTTKPNEMPHRKYFFGSVHLEWIVLRGRAQIYEISVYMSDLTSLVVYTVPEAMQKQPETMENLGFVANPDRHEFYFVQVGVGCVKTLTLAKAVEKVAHFLEEKRNTTNSENRNNGVVLNVYSDEELALLLRAIESTGNKNLLLDTVKGFGTVEGFMERNRSKKMAFSAPVLQIGENDSFYHTEVRKGLKSSNLVSKNKGEALHQAVEFYLEGPATFKSYIHANCQPSFSPRLETVKKRQRQFEEMYHLEVYLAANLKAQKTPLFLEGVFQPSIGKDLRDRPTVVASRICRILVEAGFDKASLTKCFVKDPEFAINSSVILDKMSMALRLKVMDQTMRCIRIIQNYFRQPAN